MIYNQLRRIPNPKIFNFCHTFSILSSYWFKELGKSIGYFFLPILQGKSRKLLTLIQKLFKRKPKSLTGLSKFLILNYFLKELRKMWIYREKCRSFKEFLSYTTFLLFRLCNYTTYWSYIRRKYICCWKRWKTFFLNWDSFHARLSSHYDAWSYKKKKHKKIKAYRKSV